MATNGEDPHPGSARPPNPKRSLYFWLNIGFVVVLIGLVFGASSQPWFLAVAIVWMAVGVYVIQKGRRNRPGPPNLFDD
jgi:hypothetical protein